MSLSICGKPGGNIILTKDWRKGMDKMWLKLKMGAKVVSAF